MDWYDWEESAFEAARKTQRPVLLFIGASWCRWCKALDREVLSSPEISSLITERFIPVRIDKDKRPDLVNRVMGCMAQRAEEEIFKRATHGDVVCGTRQLQNLPDLVDELRERLDRLKNNWMPQRL